MYFLALGTIFVGVPSVVLACAMPGPPEAEELTDSPSYKRLRMALIVFTFGVLLGVLPFLPIFFSDRVTRTLLPFPSFFAIAWSWYLTFRSEGPGKRVLQIGAVLVLCIDVLGLSLLVFSAAVGI